MDRMDRMDRERRLQQWEPVYRAHEMSAHEIENLFGQHATLVNKLKLHLDDIDGPKARRILSEMRKVKRKLQRDLTTHFDLTHHMAQDANDIVDDLNEQREQDESAITNLKGKIDSLYEVIDDERERNAALQQQVHDLRTKKRARDV